LPPDDYAIITLMTRKKQKYNSSANLDGVFILKLTLYVLLGSLWLKVSHGGSNLHLPIPVGFAVGLLFASHEHFRIDKKIEYAVLVIATLIGFMAPYGLFVNF